MTAKTEIVSGDRFGFGDNWKQFLDLLDDQRIRMAEQSLTEHLGDLDGRRFVDAGSGSGLFSLAARNLGAEVVSFDFDPSSVACTAELRRRYHPDDERWVVLEASVLDGDFLARLGTFDVVYSWGVLHHTGRMWDALGNVAGLVAPGGTLFVSIYNDQGRTSRMWRRVKKAYNAGSPVRRSLIVIGADTYFRSRQMLPARNLYRRLRGRAPIAVERGRGMDRRRDLVDWVGGWPFEVAKPEQVFDFYRSRGFTLEQMKTCGGGLGCNEFVFGH